MTARAWRHWKAALFDLDGTLVDSEPANQAAYATYFAERGWQVDTDTVRLFAGRRGPEVFASLEGPWTGEDPAGLASAVLSHLDLDTYPPIPLPGAADFVRNVRAHGIAIALVTSAWREWAEYAVGDLLGVRDCFDDLITSEDTAAGKPDPAPYAAGVSALAVPGESVGAFEDTDAGIRSARSAGIGHVIGVCTGSDAETLLDAGAHDTVANLAELNRSDMDGAAQ